MKSGGQNHPYYKDLDFAEPRIHPDDYEKAGLTRPQRKSHCGRGPKGYRREDAAICEDVCDALMIHPEVDASGIEVRVENGEVTLGGTVDNRYARRIADDIAQEVDGVTCVRNKLHIQRPAEATTQPVLTVREQGADLEGSTQRS
jgi:hypothetical protein